ncbi:uncharacterized protein zmp:0000001127 [Engraulis encrasicolus]|uniref:uncharacterized protein zmp:0000001127 n=1 Tax=Engraulis encrasicolus TaxID=184585 RepID=UPI002FD6B49B
MQDDLFKGLNCTEQSMEINPRTQTVSACAPQDGCLLNILEDLNFYRGALQSHPDYNAVLGPTVLKNIDTFMQVSAHPENKFEERLRLCKTLWGFRARIITINRSLRYIFCAKNDF